MTSTARRRAAWTLAAILAGSPTVAAAAIAPITGVMRSAIDRACMPAVAAMAGWPARSDRPIPEQTTDVGLLAGATPEAATALGAEGRQLVEGATLASSPPYPDGSFLLAMSRRERTCRLLFFRTDRRGPALASCIADTLVLRPEPWSELPARAVPGGVERRFAIPWSPRTGAMRALLTLWTPAAPASRITAVITIAAIPPGGGAPRGN